MLVVTQHQWVNWLAVSKHHLVQWHSNLPLHWHRDTWVCFGQLLHICWWSAVRINATAAHTVLNNARFLFRITFWHLLINFISSIWIHHYPVNGIKSDMNWQEETPKCVLIPENLPRHPKWWVQEHNVGCPVKMISKASTLY